MENIGGTLKGITYLLMAGIIMMAGIRAAAQDDSFMPGPDHHKYIDKGKALAVHDLEFRLPDTSGDYIISQGPKGDLFANSKPGRGDFEIKSRLRIRKVGATDAAFKIGDNYFGFDGQQTDIFLNGPIFGDEVISVNPNKKFFKAGRWFDFEIIRRDSSIRFLIDGNEVYAVTYDDSFKGKMGFHPAKASIEISEFSASGNLIPVSLQPPWFDIPIVDISNETGRQVIIDKEKGQYLGHPTSVLLEDGESMYIVYPKGHGGGQIVMKKSTDRGNTWSDRLRVPDSWKTSKEVPTLYPTVDKKGTKRIIMFSGLSPIRLAVSEDKGETWSELEQVFDFGGIVAMGDVIRLNNGDYMAFFHDDARFINGDMKRGRFTVYSTTSRDGGLTWSNPGIVATDKHMDLCEPGAVRSPDGNQIALLLRENSRKYNSQIVISDDEGFTWTKTRELPSSLTGDRHQCHYAKDGRLVITFRDHAYQSPTSGDFVAWVGTYEDLVEGREGQYRVRLLDNKSDWDCGYPAFEIFPDGSFFAATYGKWEKDQANYIKGVKFTLDEIDDKARIIPLYTDVFIEGEEGYNTYRIPALWHTGKGTLLAFAEGRESRNDHAANDIVMKRSNDGGISWGELQLIADQGDDCLNNPLIVEDIETGRLILMYQKYPLGYHESRVGPGYDSDTTCRNYIQYSSDDGHSWSGPKEITRMVKRPTWATSIAGGPGRGIQIKNGPHRGRLIMPFNQGPAGKWKVYAVYSDDGGDTWMYGEVAFEKDQGYGNEVQMVELSDGSLMLNCRSADGKKVRKTAISYDGGENWTGLKNDFNLIEPQCMASIIGFDYSGLDKPPLIYSGPNSKTSRLFGTLHVSFDDGNSWPVNKCFYNGSFAYSCLSELDDNSLGVLFERDDYSVISFMKIDIEWLTGE